MVRAVAASAVPRPSLAAIDFSRFCNILRLPLFVANRVTAVSAGKVETCVWTIWTEPVVNLSQFVTGHRRVRAHSDAERARFTGSAGVAAVPLRQIGRASCRESGGQYV